MGKKCNHSYGEVVEVLPSDIHKVMAGSDLPLQLFKCKHCGQYFHLNAMDARHANMEEIKYLRELCNNGDFYKMDFCEPTSVTKERLIEKMYHALEKVLAKEVLDELVKVMKGD